MRPFIFHTFTITLLAFTAGLHADDFQGTRCHIRMDDGQRQEIYFNKVGQSVESRLGTISVPENVNTLQFDQDVYEITDTGIRPSQTGSMRLKTFGMDESDENMQDAGYNKYTQDFDLDLATELYIRKDQEQGMLTCTDIGKELSAGTPGIQNVTEMPAYYNQGKALEARIEGYYTNARLAKASVDTKLLIQNREANFMKLIMSDVAKLQLKDDSESLGDLFVRKLKEAKIIESDAYTHLELENVSSGNPEVSITSKNKNKVEILERSSGREYNVIRNRDTNLSESLDKANMLIPAFSAIIKDRQSERKISISFDKSGRMTVNGTEKSQGSARAAFYSASQYATLEEPLVTTFSSTATDEFDQIIAGMGAPAVEVKLPSTNQREHKIKLDEQKVFNELIGALTEQVRKNPPTKDQVAKALAESGLEKKIDATQLGMARLVFAEGLRLMYGLEANKDERINKILEKRIEALIQAKAKKNNEKLLVKLMFTDRMKVVAAIERELKINLAVGKLDDVKTFQTKVGGALQKIKSKKQQNRVMKRLQAWILRQPVSFNGLLSWTSLDQETPENRKQVLKLLMGMLGVSQSTKNLTKADIRGINEDFARMLISLTNKG